MKSYGILLFLALLYPSQSFAQLSIVESIVSSKVTTCETCALEIADLGGSPESCRDVSTILKASECTQLCAEAGREDLKEVLVGFTFLCLKAGKFRSLANEILPYIEIDESNQPILREATCSENAFEVGGLPYQGTVKNVARRAIDQGGEKGTVLKRRFFCHTVNPKCPLIAGLEGRLLGEDVTTSSTTVGATCQSSLLCAYGCK